MSSWTPGQNLDALKNLDMVRRKPQVFPQVLIRKSGNAAGRIHAQVKGHPVGDPMVDGFDHTLS